MKNDSTSEDVHAASRDIVPSLGESSTAGTRLALLILGHRQVGPGVEGPTGQPEISQHC